MLMSFKMAFVTMSLFVTSSTIASVKLCVESLDHFFFCLEFLMGINVLLLKGKLSVEYSFVNLNHSWCRAQVFL